MSRYINRPPEVDADQYTGNNRALLTEKLGRDLPPMNIGDWLVTADNTSWVMSDTQFHDNYVEAPAATQQPA
jgi:hypothetical protein